jgi:hypothetical protein
VLVFDGDGLALGRGLVCLRCLGCGRRVWCRPARLDCCHCGSVARAHDQLALRAPPVHQSERRIRLARTHRDRLSEIRDLVDASVMTSERAFALVTACRDLLAVVDRAGAPVPAHPRPTGRPRPTRPVAQLGLAL